MGLLEAEVQGCGASVLPKYRPRAMLRGYDVSAHMARNTLFERTWSSVRHVRE